MEGLEAFSGAVLMALAEMDIVTYKVFMNTAPSMKLDGNRPLTSLQARLLREILDKYLNPAWSARPSESVFFMLENRLSHLDELYPKWTLADRTIEAYVPYELPILKREIWGLLNEDVKMLKEEKVELDSRKHLRNSGMLHDYREMLPKVIKTMETLIELLDPIKAAPEEVILPKTAILKQFMKNKDTGATKLFELVGSTLNNRRAKLEKAGNKIINYLRDNNERKRQLKNIDRTKTTNEMALALNDAVEYLSDLQLPVNGELDVPDDIKEVAIFVEENIVNMEADAIVSTVIILAIRAKREGQNIVIGLGTDWIPGYNEKGIYRDALNPLVRTLSSLDDTLRSMGLSNVELVIDRDQALAGTVMRQAADTSTELKNVIILASKSAIDSAAYAELRSSSDNKRAFLAGVDPLELDERPVGESDMRVNVAEILSMLSLSLELALGKDPRMGEDSIIDEYNEVLRRVIFMPKAFPMEYEELKEYYNAQRTALLAA